jgi:hypothetical protein
MRFLKSKLNITKSIMTYLAAIVYEYHPIEKLQFYKPEPLSQSRKKDVQDRVSNTLRLQF